MFQKIDKFIEKLASWLLIICIFSIVLYSFFEIILRQFEITYLWISPLIRHLVFLCSFLGATLATGSEKHIRIDVLSKIVDPTKKKFILLEVFIYFVTFLICLWLTYAAFEFFQFEREFGKDSFWGIHSSYLTFIAPFGFTLITYRFFYLIVKGLKKLK